MSPSLARQLTFWGLLASVAGVVILFYYGMPFHVPTYGHNYIFDSSINKPDIALEHRYEQRGYAGLAFLIVGTLLQMVPLLLPPTK